MILRIDRWQTELPPPSDPDPNGASAVQELLGGRFGEMSTLMNYTYQSFNFRNRDGARPFYDLIANIAAEEYGHITSSPAARAPSSRTRWASRGTATTCSVPGISWRT
jgi:Mn-containing catalase